MTTILVIEDEQDLSDLVTFNLRKEGYGITAAADGPTGLLSARTSLPDLILLDIMLPGLSGIEVCKSLKGDRRTSAIPVIMLTARGEEIDRVVGFEVGADDYVVKPFSMRELLLRVKAVLRRNMETAPGKLVRVGDLVIDPERHSVTSSGSGVILTTIEFKLLLYLAERPGRLQSRDTLLRNVWGFGYEGDTRTVDTHITRLRTKLGESGGLITTVRGFGYKMEEP